MNKIILFALVIFMSISVCSCGETNSGDFSTMQNFETPTADSSDNQVFSRIIVKEEPDSLTLQYLYDLFGYEFDSFQNALDELVDRYNEKRDNNDLFIICMTVPFSNYIQNNETLEIEYFSQFFDTVWKDPAFNQQTLEYQYNMALTLLGDMYRNGMARESVDFYDKYIKTLADKNEIVSFTLSYSDLYFNDKNPDHDALELMFERSKHLEKEYFDEVYDVNQAVILSIISEFAEELNDYDTADEYEKKAMDILDNLEEISS